MTTILCPVDFSEHSRKSLDYAVGLARLLDARLLLAYFAPVPYLDPDMFIAGPMTESLEDARRDLAKLCADLAAQVACDHVVQSGSAPDMTVALARERCTDWIVMSTKGAGNTPEALVGSVAADVARHAPCPVLVVPQGFAYRPLQKLVLATDFGHTRRQLLTPFMELARTARAEVVALHIEKDAAELTEEKTVEALRLEEWLGEVPATLEVMAGDDVQEGIDAYVQQHGADLVAVVARRHGFFASLFHRSVTRLVALYTTVPLLVLPEQE